MKKIFVNKSDEVSVIVEKMIEAEDREITLSVPRFSHIGGSLGNFYLLKREADAIGKKVFVESVDDKVIELAAMSGLTGTNPFFAKNTRQFSDIVAPTQKTGKATAPRVRSVRPAPRRSTGDIRTSSRERVPIFSPAPEDPHEKEPEQEIRREPRMRSFPTLSMPSVDMPDVIHSHFLRWTVIGVLGCALVFYLATAVLPRADVKLIPQKTQWSYDNAINAVPGATADISTMTIPAQVFSETGNDTKPFPATGKKQVQQYATGTITIFNAYSSQPQQLVATTRFMTPDGKIFRLDRSIMVPAAQIVDGNVVASSTEAMVTADQPGPDYNIGPVQLFTIPGFQGTPKYKTFYGTSSANMTGGFTGEVAYPTPGDIAAAEKTAAADLQDALTTKLLSEVPNDFKILDGAQQFSLTSQTPDTTTDANGNFTILTKATATAIAFKESDAVSLLENKALSANTEQYAVGTTSLTYDLARADFTKGQISFPVHFSATLARVMDAAALKAKIAGKSETDLKTTIFALPGLDSATISLWPFWVKTVPTSPDKITVTIAQ
ncbi:hypothetical protein KGO95_02775 [Patescibacteria group bacterium]|nr:hypothetical protein [Patescibacteria group bacterium]